MTTPKVGAPELVEGQAVPETTVNEQIRRVESGASHYLVVDKDLTSPPGSCADGATYIVGGGGGAWAGHTGDIAIAVGTNAASGWYFRDPEEGVLAWVQDENTIYYCSLGTSPATWEPLPASLISGIVELVQDTVGVMAVAGTGVSLSYDDASGTLTISSTGTGSSIQGGGVTTEPQGRLTLTSQTPIMAADVTGASALYYTPYVGEFVPIYESGSPAGWFMTEFSQLTINLDSASSPPLQASGSLYDVFIWNDGGTVRGGFGPAWASATSRGTGAGTTELQLKDGIWTNAAAINLNNGATTYSSIPANEATYVGTIYCTANGQTGMAMYPSGAAGGSNNILGVYNAYNRRRTLARCLDSTASWTYATTTWRTSNNSASNRISYVDGLAQSAVSARVQDLMGISSTATFGAIGANRDSTSATPGLRGGGGGADSGSQTTPIAHEEFAPSLGFHYIQGMENREAGGTCTFYGAGYFAVTVTLDM